MPLNSYAVYCVDPVISIKIRIENSNSIFDAEAFAILHALLEIESLNLKEALIASDSLSVLSGLEALDVRGFKHPLLYLINGKLRELSAQNFDIHLYWIPSHVGILGNEYMLTS